MWDDRTVKRDTIAQMQLSEPIRSVGCSTAFLTAGLLAYARTASAGDMDAVGYLILGIYLYLGIAIALSVLAVVACKRIKSRWWRAATRLLIVVAVYTPVPQAGLYEEIAIQPAFLAALGNHSSLPHAGWLSHPFLMAYGGALLLGLPVVMLWTYVTARYSRA